MVQEIKMGANVVTVKVDGKCASCPLAPSYPGFTFGISANQQDHHTLSYTLYLMPTNEKTEPGT